MPPKSRAHAKTGDKPASSFKGIDDFLEKSSAPAGADSSALTSAH